MRQIQSSVVSGTVARLCQRINFELPEEIVAALEAARATESNPRGRQILDELLENAQVARDQHLPLCQDTGLVVVFAELGDQVQIIGHDIYEAINEGVSQGYQEGYLRPSVLAKPLQRDTNTGDNTPAIVHLVAVPGEQLTIHLMAKGGGSENMSALWMLPPATGRQGIIQTITEHICQAGGKPCPPLVLGVGIGGNFEKAPLLAKEALLRPLGQPNDDTEVAQLEQDILEAVNQTDVGPMGLGGDTTALAVHILTHPCHLASLPLALNVQCHAARHATAIL